MLDAAWQVDHWEPLNSHGPLYEESWRSSSHYDFPHRDKYKLKDTTDVLMFLLVFRKMEILVSDIWEDQIRWEIWVLFLDFVYFYFYITFLNFKAKTIPHSFVKSISRDKELCEHYSQILSSIFIIVLFDRCLWMRSTQSQK